MTKRIIRNKATKDYDMYADGEYIGSCRSAVEAMHELDAYVYQVLSDLGAALADEQAERDAERLEVA